MHLIERAGIYLSCFVVPTLIAYSLSGLHRLSASYSELHVGDGLDSTGNSGLSPFLFQGTCVVVALLLVEIVILLLIAASFYRTVLAAVACLIFGMMFPILTGIPY